MKRKKRENGEDEDNGFAAWGGYMEAKKSKLLEQFNNAASNEMIKQSNIFNGISISVNGYTKPSAEELRHLMALHGGIYHHYHIPSKTTYTIASNLPDTKIKQMGPNQKIVKPEWITDCLQAGKLLNYSKYLLYTNCNRKQPRLNFEKIVKEETETESKVINEDDEEYQLSPDIFEPFDNEIINNDITNNKEKQDISLQNKTNILENNDFKLPASKKEKMVEKPSRTLTANDPKFLTEFYNNSRLHHISTLGATFKQHVCNLREQSNFKFPERLKFIDYLKDIKREMHVDNFSGSTKPVIMHIDMDCFFVSVGLRKRPELRGVPVAVTHSKGGQEPTLRSGVDRQAELECYKQRAQEKLKLKNVELGPGNMLNRLEGIENQSMSEIASCSYEARKAGVKNGMFMGTALKLCPNLHTIPYDFDGYKEVAHTLYNTISEYTLNIEAVSCDEMFVDITGLLKETGATVTEWATYIRSLIKNRTGCPCSTGFGENRLQARVATKTAKPNGQFHLIPDAVEEYMVDIKVGDLPGVGRSTSLKLETFGVKTCGDLQSMTIGQLRSEFGNKIGESLYNHCRGIDGRQLVYEHERKSVSAEVNYGIRFKNNTEAETFLKQLASEVHTRLTEIKMKGKSITLKLMVRSKDAPEESSKFMGHGICDYITKSNSLSVATNELSVIEREILSIAQKLAVPPQDLRGIGIQINRLEKNKNTSLFGGITKFLNSSTITKISTAENKNKENNTVVNNLKNETDEKLNNISKNRNSTFIDNLFKNKENGQNNKQNMDMKVVKEQVKITETIKIEKKNSPIKSNQMNTIKRGRGRPRGRGGKTIERKNSNNGNLTKFLAVPSTSNTVQERVQVELIGVDMEVFAALPEDIQKEILAEYNQTVSIQTEINTIDSPTKQNINVNIDKKKTVSNILPNKNMKEEDANQRMKTNDAQEKLKNETKIITITEDTSEIEVIPSTSKTDINKNENCMFSGLDMKQIKNLIEDWVSSQNSPEQCDVKMLGEYFKQLALDKNIDSLFLILKFLFSEIMFKNTCGWHKAYFEIVNSAQEGMLVSYGSNIWTHKNFKCINKCHLKNR